MNAVMNWIMDQMCIVDQAFDTKKNNLEICKNFFLDSEGNKPGWKKN